MFDVIAANFRPNLVYIKHMYSTLYFSSTTKGFRVRVKIILFLSKVFHIRSK